MRFYEELARYVPSGDTVITIGVFDGVHKGHMHLLRHLREEARRLGASSCVLTFVNHPRTVLRPGSEVKRITTLEQRTLLFKGAGTDIVVPLTFDEGMSNIRARDFVDALRKHLHMKGMVVGPNFAMGYQREGTPKILAAIGQESGFSMRVVEPLRSRDQMISSSAIRDCISRGDVALAAKMLDRPFSLSCKVIRGDGKGKELGFPTANLEIPEDMAVPGDGVYVTWANVEGGRFMSATSIGIRPTFGVNARTVEAFLMDFQGNLYGKETSLEFLQRLRDELRFDTVEDLKAQMARDVEQAREILESQRPFESSGP